MSLIMFVLVCEAEEMGLCVRSDVGCCARGRGVNGVAEKGGGVQTGAEIGAENLVGACPRDESSGFSELKFYADQRFTSVMSP